TTASGSEYGRGRPAARATSVARKGSPRPTKQTTIQGTEWPRIGRSALPCMNPRLAAIPRPTRTWLPPMPSDSPISANTMTHGTPRSHPSHVARTHRASEMNVIDGSPAIAPRQVAAFGTHEPKSADSASILRAFELEDGLRLHGGPRLANALALDDACGPRGG